MQQNPYCSWCWNSLVINQEKDDFFGICDKCRIVRTLSTKEKEDYLHNEKCKTKCKCGGTAYVHNDDDFYECWCCSKKKKNYI